MIPIDLEPTMIGALLVILGLVAWRKAIAAPPKWLPLTVGLLQAGIVGGMAFAYFGLRGAEQAVATANPADKASSLATGIASSMWGVAASGACALAAAIVLAVATFQSRKVGRDDLPTATARDN